MDCVAAIDEATFFGASAFVGALFDLEGFVMKRIFRSVLACLLTIVMTVGSTPLAGFVGFDLLEFNLLSIKAEAATYSGACGENLTWTFDEATGKFVISGSGAMFNYSYNNRPWEAYKDKIQSVAISNGVTSIGDNAFYECSNLTSVAIPDGILRIGELSFALCNSITNINIPKSVACIGKAAFGGCRRLEKITVDADNEYYLSDDNIMYDKSKTEIILYPAGKTNAHYTINDGIKSIGYGAFVYCYNLTSITIPDSVTSLGWAAFGGSALTKIIGGNGIVRIGEYAFAECYRLTNVIVSDSVTSIGEYAFSDCNKLETVTMSSQIERIDQGAFYNCNDLVMIKYPGTLEDWNRVSVAKYNEELIGNILFECNSEQPYYCKGKYGENVYVILNEHGILEITGTGEMYDVVTEDNIAFWENRHHIKTATLSDGITRIGNYTFVDCDHLTSVIIPESVTSIGIFAFADCKRLSTVFIMGKSVEIGTGAVDDETVICCYSDSTAYTYAKTNGLDCYLLDKKDIIKKPTQSKINYGDTIMLCANMNEALPSGWTIKWTADNGNFSYSANGETLTITPSKSGDTTFTATVYDENGNEISKDTQTMKSKAGFFDKIIAFFKKLFGLTKTIPQIYNGIF